MQSTTAQYAGFWMRFVAYLKDWNQIRAFLIASYKKVALKRMLKAFEQA